MSLLLRNNHRIVNGKWRKFQMHQFKVTEIHECMFNYADFYCGYFTDTVFVEWSTGMLDLSLVSSRNPSLSVSQFCLSSSASVCPLALEQINGYYRFLLLKLHRIFFHIYIIQEITYLTMNCWVICNLFSVFYQWESNRTYTCLCLLKPLKLGQEFLMCFCCEKFSSRVQLECPQE